MIDEMRSMDNIEHVVYFFHFSEKLVEFLHGQLEMDMMGLLLLG